MQDIPLVASHEINQTSKPSYNCKCQQIIPAAQQFEREYLYLTVLLLSLTPDKRNVSPSNKTIDKYKIKRTFHGARVTVYGNAIDQIVADYTRLRLKLESEGFKVAPED